MKLNLEDGIFIQVAGTIGQYNTLPIEILVKLMENMQNLLQNIAISVLDETEGIDLNQIKVELCDFKAANGAVPKLKYSPRHQQKVVAADFDKQRAVISKEFENLISVSNEPRKLTEYLRVRFRDVERRNNIVQLFHAFSNAAGTSPMAVVQFDEHNQPTPLYPVRRMTIGQRDALLIDVKQSEPVMEHETVFRKVQITKVNGKVMGKSKILAEYMVNAATEISYSFKNLNYEERSYELHSALHCKVERDEEDNYIIKSEMLNIEGKAETEDEAAKAFEAAFDTLYIYSHSPNADADDEQQARIKKLLALLVKEVH
ncbi:MAG: hypothetical protein JNL70_21730 [Saprospiraceae bacterium]|nr:hypothetical protein [Saprospiraceae bacterium]